jgi:voltage-gated potassium channel
MADSDHRISDIRRSVYVELEPSARTSQGLSPTNMFLVLVTLLGAVTVILETEVTLQTAYANLFRAIEVAIGLIFAIEFVLRVWAVTEAKPNAGPLVSRLKFIFSFDGMFDLLIILSTLLPFVTANLVLLRLFRLVRLLRIAKLGRMSRAFTSLSEAVHSRRYELLLTLYLAIGLLVLGATAMYWVEGTIQPDKFGSIPRSLWWAVITMTTIGYGDVYPITSVGRVIASLVAIAGIGLIAMPTGILAAAFSDAIQKHKLDDETEDN